jgi:hypothetical protein
MNKKTFLFQSIISVTAVIGLAYGRLFSVPDAVSKIFGLPLNWGVHQLVTIAGPVDIWSVNVTYLVLDLIFWLTILLGLPMIVERGYERA